MHEVKRGQPWNSIGRHRMETKTVRRKAWILCRACSRSLPLLASLFQARFLSPPSVVDVTVTIIVFIVVDNCHGHLSCCRCWISFRPPHGCLGVTEPNHSNMNLDSDQHLTQVVSLDQLGSGYLN